MTTFQSLCSGWATSRARSEIYISIKYQVLRILPRCHPHLEPPWVTTYWKVVVLSWGNTWCNAWSLSFYGLPVGNISCCSYNPPLPLRHWFLPPWGSKFISTLPISCGLSYSYFLEKVTQELCGDPTNFLHPLDFRLSWSKPLSFSKARLQHQSTFDALPQTCALGITQETFPITKLALKPWSHRYVLGIVAWCAWMVIYV